MTVGGPANEPATFQQAAAGPGTIYWRVDFAVQEEGWFNLMAGLPKPRRSISIDGAHILAGQLRDAMQAQHAAAEPADGHGSVHSTCMERVDLVGMEPADQRQRVAIPPLVEHLRLHQERV